MKGKTKEHLKEQAIAKLDFVFNLEEGQALVSCLMFEMVIYCLLKKEKTISSTYFFLFLKQAIGLIINISCKAY